MAVMLGVTAAVVTCTAAVLQNQVPVPAFGVHDSF